MARGSARPPLMFSAHPPVPSLPLLSSTLGVLQAPGLLSFQSGVQDIDEKGFLDVVVGVAL
jgi:hypothetical protein